MTLSTEVKHLRLYTEAGLSEDTIVQLTADQAHYLVRVMRREVGALLLLFNGKDGEWEGELVAVSKSSATVKLLRQTRPQKRTPDLWLLFAPVKRAPLDQIAQKATELGVSLLNPVRTARTIVTRVREDRLVANAIEAAEQCERLDVPQVSEMTKLTSLLDQWPTQSGGADEGVRKIMFCDEAGDQIDARWGGANGRALPVMEALKPFQGQRADWAILTGPEGGFTPEERDLLRSRAFVVPVTLGPRILRADTAAFAAITLWQAALGDFNTS